MMKRFLRVALLLCAATVLVSALSFKTTGAKAAPSSEKVSQNRVNSNSCGKWSVVPSPHPNVNSGLSGVAAISATDAWAVGSSGSQLSGSQTLIEQWNGSQWQIVTSPSPASSINSLYDVSAVAANDVWAVGYDANSNGATQTLIEHWNGTHWSVVTSPSPASVDNELFSVAAVSASDVWAVGFSASKTSEKTLIEHWNGSHWSVVTSPNPGTNSELSSVAAVSASDVWAVGASNTMSQTLIERWNGSSWSVVKSPNPGSGGVLTGVAVASANDVWATGYDTKSSSIQTLAEYWNGSSWRVVKTPNVGTHPSFWGVTAVSATDVWAVGSDGNSKVVDKTLTEQWNGSQWSVVTSPSPGSFSTQLASVSATSARNVWAVGHADSNPLIEHYHC